jgi:DNA-binding MarR family transcriptional regulator
MTESPSDVAARTLVHLRRIFHAIRARSVTIKKRVRLSGPQIWALHAVAASEKGLALGEIASHLAVHKASAGRVVEALLEKKLVASERPSRDRRFVIVTATKKGRDLLAKPGTPLPLQVQLLESLSRVPEAELVAIEGTLARLVQLIGAENIEPGFIFDKKEE